MDEHGTSRVEAGVQLPGNLRPQIRLLGAETAIVPHREMEPANPSSLEQITELPHSGRIHFRLLGHRQNKPRFPSDNSDKIVLQGRPPAG